MAGLAFEGFPDVYTGRNAPAAFGARVPGKRYGTPLYSYGWLVSRAELYEAISGEPAFTDISLCQIYIGAGRLLARRWREKGYDDNEYNPNVPSAEQFNSKYVVIFIACNDSDSIISSVMKTKKFHDECRVCLGNPRAMESEPAWIRVGMKYFPDELSGTFTSNVHQPSLGRILVRSTLLYLLFFIMSYVLISFVVLTTSCFS